jgi:hypothetical protein
MIIIERIGGSKWNCTLLGSCISYEVAEYHLKMGYGKLKCMLLTFQNHLWKQLYLKTLFCAFLKQFWKLTSFLIHEHSSILYYGNFAQEGKAIGLWVQGQPGLHREQPCLRKNKERMKEKNRYSRGLTTYKIAILLLYRQ